MVNEGQSAAPPASQRAATNQPLALTAVRYGENNTQVFGQDDKRSSSRYPRLAQEGYTRIIGPMPPQDFLDAFLKTETSTLLGMPDPAGAFAKVPDPRERKPRKKKTPNDTTAGGSGDGADEGQSGAKGKAKSKGASKAKGKGKGNAQAKDKGKGKGKGKVKGKGKATAEDETGDEGNDNDHEDKDKENAGTESQVSEKADVPGISGQAPKAKTKEESEKPLKEIDIYAPVIEALNPTHQDKATGLVDRPSRCPGFVFCDTSGRADKGNGEVGSVKPDICGYAEEHVEAVTENGIKARTDMGVAAIFIEVKVRTDVFNDPTPDMTGDALRDHKFIVDDTIPGGDPNDATDAFGQNIAYASELCARQFRHFCFSVSLTGCMARLMRWDRAGAIVTEAFDLRKNPEYLCHFFWYFAQLSDEARGHDLSVEVANDKEEAIFKQTVLEHLRVQLNITPDTPNKEVPGLYQHYEKHRVSAIQLQSTPGEGFKCKLLVSRPMTSPLSVFGRCARAWWAVRVILDAKTGAIITYEIVFLKDTWRYDARPYDKQEGGILLFLHTRNVPNIPPVKEHEDVHFVTAGGDGNCAFTEKVQSTVTQEFLNASWNCRKHDERVITSKHTHYRLTLGIVGYPLIRFTGSRELFRAARDAFNAMRGAYEYAKYIHRDISPGNIILYREPPMEPRSDAPADDTESGLQPAPAVRKGYLCDWDLSRAQGENRFLEEYEVSATWQFQPMATLQKSHQTPLGHTILHDMESMLYVMLYCSLVFLPVSGDAQSCIRYMFDEFRPVSKTRKAAGGDGKARNLMDRKYTAEVSWTNKTVEKWLNKVMDLCRDDKAGPRHSQLSEYSATWDSDKLCKKWDEFLQKHGHELEMDDRERNIDLIPPTHTDRRISRTLQNKGYASPRPFGSHPRKHDFSEVDTDSSDQPTTKKRRITQGRRQTKKAEPKDRVLPLSNATTSVATEPPMTAPEQSEDDSDVPRADNWLDAGGFLQSDAGMGMMALTFQVRPPTPGPSTGPSFTFSFPLTGEPKPHTAAAGGTGVMDGMDGDGTSSQVAPVNSGGRALRRRKVSFQGDSMTMAQRDATAKRGKRL